MKKKDILELRATCGAYSLARSLYKYLDEMRNDLPETIECYDLIEYLRCFLNDLSSHRYETADIFLSACYDNNI